jgi:hypothetical protein
VLVTLAVIAFAQDSRTSAWNDSETGWSEAQHRWMYVARIEARLGAVVGQRQVANRIDRMHDYELSAVREHIPATAGPKGAPGRRDEDHDGVPDWRDLCPNIKARRGEYGCPTVWGPPVSVIDDPKAVAALRGRAQDLMHRLELGLDVPADLDAALGLAAAPTLIRALATGDWVEVTYTEAGVVAGDPDTDGVYDEIDACPVIAEDLDGYLDADGCPESDDPPAAPPSVAVLPVTPVTPVAPASAAAPVVAVAAVTPPASRSFPSVEARLTTGKQAKNDTAVVIGLEDYFAIADVPYARRDADAFYNFLLYTRGIPQERIQSLSAGGKEHLAAAVERAGQEVGPGGTVWVYFAGHGAANPRDGERMLLGDDVRSDAIGFASRGIGVAEIERLASAKGGAPMLVLDTCYSGVGRAGGALIAGARFAVPQYTAKTTGMQWNAASADQVSAPLEPAQHGAFTYFAVGALRGWADGELDGVRDGQVTGREAQAYVRRALRATQKNDQQPVWAGPNDPVLSSGGTEVGPSL